MKIDRHHLAWCGVIVAATALVYFPVLGFGFVDFDDDVYITDNPAVRAGLGLRGVLWAFTTGYAANWHPLTWLSHMLDVSLFGLNAGFHHGVNLALHLANALLVYALFVRTTGHRFASAVVALLFGLHPLHVESVAWISERKDLLSAFFGLASLHFHAAWFTSRRARDYRLALACFGLALLAKPMLVTLPFVMLLFDAWPLRRFDLDPRANLLACLREKIPFFLLSLGSSVATVVAQRSWGAMEIGQQIALPERLANAVVSYVRYLGKTFWPSDLSLLYPHPYAPGGLPYSGTQIALALALLAAITAVVIAWRRQPVLAVGWFWFVGMLVPVIGIVQVGGQAMADRYTYLPHVGLFAGVVFAVREWTHARSAVRIAAIVVAAAAVLASAALAHRQTQVWRDSLTLLDHASSVTPGNPIIDNHLAAVYQRRGQIEEAIRHYRRALQFDGDNPRTHSNLGHALQQEGRGEEAIEHFERAIALAPDYTHALSGLGASLATAGRLAEAERHFARALEIDPELSEVHANLGTVLRMRGKLEPARSSLERAVELAPANPASQHALGIVLLEMERAPEAIAAFERALELDPRHPMTREALARAKALARSELKP